MIACLHTTTYYYVLWMKGCEVYKAKTASDCLAQLERLDSKVDVVVVSGKIALDRNAMLIVTQH